MAYLTYAEAEIEYLNLPPVKTFVWDGSEYTYVDVFEHLTESEMTRYINAAFNFIEGLSFSGEKLDPEQLTQFPRDFESEVSTAIKQANLALALNYALNDLLMASTDPEMVIEMQSGIKNNKVDLGDASRSTTYGSSKTSLGVLKPYLSGYLKGAYPIVSRKYNKWKGFF